MTMQRPHLPRTLPRFPMGEALRPVASGLVILMLACFAGVAFGADGKAADKSEIDFDPQEEVTEEDYEKLLKHVKPHEPGEVGETFRLADGYRVQLVAHEPMVTDPVAMAFDAKGRLYVVEMRGYSEDREDRLGRIRRLTDTDGDGVMDESIIYADGLAWPTAVFPWKGGIFVGVEPDVLYLKDTDGDGKADRKETVFTDLGPADREETNVQLLVNSFRWGLDNRIHGVRRGGRGIRRPDQPKSERIDLGRYDFKFDPETKALEATTGGGQFGLSFDDWGRRFTCYNSNHLYMLMYERGYIGRNPHMEAPAARQSIGAGGRKADLFRLSPPEGWRIIRTQLRAQGEVRGSVERGGELHGYVTGASGVIIYRGDRYPERMRGASVTGEVGNNLLHRNILKPNGVPMKGIRVDQEGEFLASNDNWFRPTQNRNAPDGTLWFVDMYRETVEHPWSLPPRIKKHLDLTSGRDRGRIYRILPEGFEQRSIPDLTARSSAELVKLLAHGNAWHRVTASRLLYERQDDAAVAPLRALLRQSDAPLGRLHALHTLNGLDALGPQDVLIGLGDEHPRVRENAVQLAEGFGDSATVRARLYAMVEDPDIRVRYQLGFSLGEIDDAGRFTALARLLKRDTADQWVRTAVYSSLNEGAGRVLATLTDDIAFLGREGAATVLQALARQIGKRDDRVEVAVAMRTLNRLEEDRPAAHEAVLRGLGDGMGQERLKEALAANDSGSGALKKMLRQARQTAGDGEAPPDERVEAIAALSLGSFSAAREALRPLLSPSQPTAVQSAAMGTLTRFDHERVGPLLIELWPELGPATRPAARQALFARPDRLRALLDALEGGDFPRADLGLQYANRLLNHPDETIASRAGEILESGSNAPRREVVRRYQEAMSELEGDASEGRTVFIENCSICHKLEDTGYDLGPNLAAFAARGSDAILENVLNPNAEINPDYVNYLVKTEDGRTLTGVIAEQTANSVTLSPGGGVEQRVPRSEIESMRSTGRSLMPENMESAISPEQMADLIEYLTTVQ